MSRKVLAVAMIMVLTVALLTGCAPRQKPGSESGQKGDSVGQETGKDSKPFKVALLTPGPATDGGWSTMAYQGLMRVKDELEAEVSHMQVKSPSDVEEGFRDYGSQGYDIVFGHSYDYQDAAKKVAPEFPKTVYITSGGTTVMDNVSPILTKFEESTYLMGVLAARMCKTGKVGAIGSIEIPAISKTIIGFTAGVKATEDKVEVMTTYLGTQSDVNKAKEAALAQINAGANMIFVNADAAGQGVLQAVLETRSKGKDVYTFGVFTRWSEKNPDAVLADGLPDYPSAFVYVAKAVKEGTWKPGVTPFGIKEGVVKFLMNEKLIGNIISEEAQEAVNKATQDIVDGKIVVPTGTY
jgi:basic membrane protein A